MSTQSASTSTGLLLLRVAFGSLMLVHGLQKLSGYSAMSESFPDPLGMGHQFALIGAISAEVGCSVLLILGLFTRIAAVPLAFTMIVALFMIHAKGEWKVRELAAVYLSVYVPLIFTGAGAFSLDHLIFGNKKSEQASDVPLKKAA